MLQENIYSYGNIYAWQDDQKKINVVIEVSNVTTFT